MKIEEILDGILFCKEHTELEQIVYALTLAWERMHPGWELTVISLPKGDSEERKRLLEGTMMVLQNAENALKNL